MERTFYWGWFQQAALRLRNSEWKNLDRNKNVMGGRQALPGQENRVKQALWWSNLKINLNFVSRESPVSLQCLCLALLSTSSQTFRSVVPKVRSLDKQHHQLSGNFNCKFWGPIPDLMSQKWAEGGNGAAICVWTSPSGDSDARSSLKTFALGLPDKHNPPRRKLMTFWVPNWATSLGAGRELIAGPSPLRVQSLAQSRFLLQYPLFQSLSSMPSPPVLLYPHRAPPSPYLRLRGDVVPAGRRTAQGDRNRCSACPEPAQQE